MYHSRFSGTHAEAGFRYGKRLKGHGIVIDSCPTFPLDKKRIEFAKECLPYYEKYTPEILDEIFSMALAQGTGFEVLPTLLFSMYCFAFEAKCTCFAFTQGDKTYFARNSDFRVELEKLNMNCYYKLKGAYSFIGNTTAFIQMEDGVNEAGLAAGLTFVYPKIRKAGIGAGLMVRKVLESCCDVYEAVELLTALPCASSHTITLADKTGAMAALECNPEKTIIRRPEKGKNFIASTNNFISEEMSEFRNPPGIDDLRSLERYESVMNAFSSEMNKDKDKDELFAMDVLSGKYGFMCSYDRALGYDTVWSGVCELKSGETYRCEGNPKRKKFVLDERMRKAKK